MIRRVALPVVVLIFGMSLTGCVPQSVSCVDWVQFTSAQDQYDAAELVVVGHVLEPIGIVDSLSGEAKLYAIEVEDVLKGRAGDATVEVASTPESCSDDAPYGNGDQLSTNERVVIFANKPEETWMTLTPFQGVIEVSPSAGYPFELEP